MPRLANNILRARRGTRPRRPVAGRVGAMAIVVVLLTAATPPEPIRIGEHIVSAGERKDLSILVSQTYSASPVRLPFTVVRGEKPGPTLCLVAGIHGDELNGVGVVRKILEDLTPDQLTGTVIGLPILNQFGFWAQSRYLPDRRDLNRYFPGSPKGSTASRIAHKIWSEILVHCTHVIDFHTGSLHRSNVPQIRGDLGLRSVMGLAHSFGSPVLVHNPGQPGTLRRAMTNAGIPTILFESGEALRFQREHVEAGVAGTRRVMRHLGLALEAPDGVAPRVYMETHWVRAEHGGIFEAHVPLGAPVTKGQLIGTITDPLNNKSREVRTQWNGEVIGMVMAPTVLPGLAVVHVGVPNGRKEASEAESEERDRELPE